MLQLFWRHLRRNERGFTLIELLIVVAIIAILAAILIPNFLRARKQAQISATKGNLKNIATALESYFVDKNDYPDEGGTGWSTDLVSGDYIRAVPVNPVGVAYDYDSEPATNAQDYVLCDDNTDPENTWYYAPGAGLKVEPGATAACPDP